MMNVSYDAFVAEELKFGCILSADQLGAGKSVIDFETGTLRFHGTVLNSPRESVCLSIGVEEEDSEKVALERKAIFLGCCGETLTSGEKEKVVEMMTRNMEVFS